MNVHKNARLTPAGRVLMIQRLAVGESSRQVAALLKISPRTVYKWQARWRAEGDEGLADRSSRSHRIPRRLPRPRRRTIEKLRKKGWSTPAIAEATGIPISTVVDTVRRLGLSRLRLTPPPPVVRYQWERPGELLHMDIKKLGRIGRVGHRIHGDRRIRGENEIERRVGREGVCRGAMEGDIAEAGSGKVHFSETNGQLGAVVTVEVRARVCPRHFQEGFARAATDVGDLRSRSQLGCHAVQAWEDDGNQVRPHPGATESAFTHGMVRAEFVVGNATAGSEGLEELSPIVQCIPRLSIKKRPGRH